MVARWAFGRHGHALVGGGHQHAAARRRRTASRGRRTRGSPSSSRPEGQRRLPVRAAVGRGDDRAGAVPPHHVVPPSSRTASGSAEPGPALRATAYQYVLAARGCRRTTSAAAGTGPAYRWPRRRPDCSGHDQRRPLSRPAARADPRRAPTDPRPDRRRRSRAHHGPGAHDPGRRRGRSSPAARSVGVVDGAEARARFPDVEVLGGPGHVVTPGFVNAHQHLTGDRLVRCVHPRRPACRRVDLHVGGARARRTTRPTTTSCPPPWPASRRSPTA